MPIPKTAARSFALLLLVGLVSCGGGPSKKPAGPRGPGGAQRVQGPTRTAVTLNLNFANGYSERLQGTATHDGSGLLSIDTQKCLFSRAGAAGTLQGHDGVKLITLRRTGPISPHTFGSFVATHAGGAENGQWSTN